MFEVLEVVYVTNININPAFCLTFHLTGVHFRGKLHHVGDVSEQKFKYGPIRTLEITDIRFLYELYICSLNSVAFCTRTQIKVDL